MSGIIQAMSFGLPYLPVHYSVATPIYTGPLDLLLQLIERAELDITRLALAQVTDQYLVFLKEMPAADPEEVSAFLVIASRLLQIKSEALLPRPPQREPGEEDPGDALARQLITYRRFKELSLILFQREITGARSYPRQAPPSKIDTSLNLEGISVNDLCTIAQWLLSQETSVPELATVVPIPRVTIREKISLIADYLKRNSQGTFTQLLSDPGYRLDIVVTFLALLELVKRRMILAQQASLFGEIDFEPAEDWSEDISFELEFGE